MLLDMRMVGAKSCRNGGKCVRWVERYLGDCVCILRDYFSLGFGLLGCLSWAVSEVPQIFTNFKSKSTDGVSLLFLMTWVVGDVFNLVGCVLEPSTIDIKITGYVWWVSGLFLQLPTQLYTAVVYTATTVVLLWQTIYYGNYVRRRRTAKAKFDLKQNAAGGALQAEDESQRGNQDAGDKHSPSQNIPISSSLKQTPYLRSPASTRSPTWWRSSLGKHLQKSSPGYLVGHLLREEEEEEDLNDSDDEDKDNDNWRSNPKKSVLAGVALTFFMVSNSSYYSSSESLVSNRGVVFFTGRKLLQEFGPQDVAETVSGSSSLGTLLGWIMAVIYMGGRLPQIYLNTRRGTVEGLNPLMFMFAVGGNAAYVASILVRTTEWEKLKANLPWLVDAVVCVLLDFLILGQFVIYKCKNSGRNLKDEDGAYVAIKKGKQQAEKP